MIVCSMCETGIFCDKCKKGMCKECFDENYGNRRKASIVRHCHHPLCRKTYCTDCASIKYCNLCHESKCIEHLTACVKCNFKVCHFPCSCIECTNGKFVKNVNHIIVLNAHVIT